MEVQFVCPESSDLTLLKKAYPDLYHDDTYNGQQSWWIGKSGEEYWDSGAGGYQYCDENGEDEPICEPRDDSKEWMSAEDAAEFCGYAETLIPDSETMLEGNGPWAQGQLRSDPDYLRGVSRARKDLGKTPRILRLNLKGCYFHAIREGTKTEEYRLAEKWSKRIVGKEFDEVHLLLGYPKAGDETRILRRKWNGYKMETRRHFGPEPVLVLAIDVTKPLP